MSIALGYYLKYKVTFKVPALLFQTVMVSSKPIHVNEPPPTPSNYKVLTEVDSAARYLATDGICCPPHAGQLKVIL